MEPEPRPPIYTGIRTRPEPRRKDRGKMADLIAIGYPDTTTALQAEEEV